MTKAFSREYHCVKKEKKEKKGKEKKMVFFFLGSGLRPETTAEDYSI